MRRACPYRGENPEPGEDVLWKVLTAGPELENSQGHSTTSLGGRAMSAVLPKGDNGRANSFGSNNRRGAFRFGGRDTTFHTAHCVMTVCSYTRIGLQRPKCTVVSTRSVGSKFVSAKNLPKTGVSALLAGDFREILARVAIFRSMETSRERTKSPQNAGF
jgi:hypothetical protein